MAKLVKAKSFSIIMEAPMHKTIGVSTENLETCIRDLRDNEQNPLYKKNYNICYTILGFAKSCWGTLNNISYGNGKILLTFEFDDFFSLTTFVEMVNKDIE